MGPDDTRAVILVNSWDAAHPTSFTLPFMQENTHLGLGAGRVHQVLAGHLDSLVSSSKLSGVYQALLSSLAVGVRDPHEVGSLGAQERQRRGSEQAWAVEEAGSTIPQAQALRGRGEVHMATMHQG